MRINRTSVSIFVLVIAVASVTVPTASAQTEAVSRPPTLDSRVASAQGKQGRVRALNGTNTKGTLVSLSSSEVVLRQDGIDRHMPLATVRRVETVSHHLRTGALTGLGIGVLSGFIVVAAMNYTEEGRFLAPLSNGGVGLGAGIAIGAIVNSATADRRVVYAGPQPSVGVTPVLSPQVVGVRFAIGW